MSRLKQPHPRPTTIDFETPPMGSRPDYPPPPVAMSVKPYHEPVKTYVWGLREGNNCTKQEAADAYSKVLCESESVLFQNARFDIDVGETHLGIAPPSWLRIHDTLFLLYLDDPDEKEIGLKPSAERLLNWPAEEQDMLVQWLLHNVPKCYKVSASDKSPHNIKRLLHLAPAGLIINYVAGDVERAEALFDHLYPRIVDRGMLDAYDAERELCWYLLEMERHGVLTDVIRLRADTERYEKHVVDLERWICSRLGDPDINLNAGQQIAHALISQGICMADDFPRTKKGLYETKIDTLKRVIPDRQLAHAMAYLSKIKKSISSFMRPWLEVADRSGGLIYTQYRQTKVDTKGGGGTRTGRISSSPNFQNMSRSPDPLFEGHGDWSKPLPQVPIEGLPALPKLRGYIKPFEGEVLISRDYSQQEPRILAHFEDGAMLQAYHDNPWMDLHQATSDALKAKGLHYERPECKQTNLGTLYGMGLAKLAERTGLSKKEAGDLRQHIKSLYAGLADMEKDLKALVRLKRPIRTWGGRQYYCQRPVWTDDRGWINYDYKQLNRLIQGSAADCTKQAMIRFFRVKDPAWRVVLTVHDEIFVSVPRHEALIAMRVLRECMESVEFDLPILTEGKISDKSVADLAPYDEKGEVVWEGFHSAT